MSDITTSSQRPYFLRAVYEWLVDNGLTPYITVEADWEGVQVPASSVQKGQVTLNISMSAVNGLELGNDEITFKARFAGVSRKIVIPIDAVRAIYARENGEGMPMPPPLRADAAQEPTAPETQPADVKAVKSVETPAQKPPAAPQSAVASKTSDKRPHLRVVK